MRMNLLRHEKVEKKYNIKDVGNLSWLKKEIDDNTVKDVRDLFRPKKENKSIKDKIDRNIKDICELENEEEDYHKPVR